MSKLTGQQIADERLAAVLATEQLSGPGSDDELRDPADGLPVHLAGPRLTSASLALRRTPDDAVSGSRPVNSSSR